MKIQIYRRLWFCNAELKGAYRYRDLFQLAPTSVRPPWRSGHWPVWIEVAVDNPLLREMADGTPMPDWRLRCDHADRIASEVVMLLNLLLKCRLFFPQGGNSWFIPYDGAGGDHQFAEQALWGQLGYTDNEIWNNHDLHAFSPVDPLPPISASDYYRRQVQPVNGSPFYEVCDVPNTIEASLDAYFRLSPAAKKVFYGALNLFNDSLQILHYGISRSLHLVALVGAIEALASYMAPNAGPTKNYKKFFETYASGVPKKFLKNTYKIRGKIIHRGHLLIRDASDWTVVDDADEYFRVWDLRDISRLAIIEWLLSIGEDGEPSRVSWG